MEETDETLAMFLEPAAESDETEQDDAETGSAPDDDQTDEEEVEAQDDDADDGDDEDEGEDEEDESDDADEEPGLIAVKVNGEEKRVTLDELKRSYSANEYAQQRMREAADLRKQVEAEREALTADRATIAQFVQSVQQSGIVPAPVAPDPSLADEDPVGYMQERARYDRQLAEYQQQQNLLHHHRQQLEAHQMEQRKAFLQQEAERLAEAIPDFADPEKQEVVKERLRKAGTEVYGFDATELQQVTDSRLVRMLHDAAKWQELQASKAKATRKEPKPQRAVKPGRPGKSQVSARKERQQLLQRARRGDTDAQVRLLME